MPLWTIYEPWGWGTGDADQLMSQLRRFGSVTVLNGHIHQIVQKVEGNITFHTARSTAYPQPVAGEGAGPGPLKVPADQLPQDARRPQRRSLAAASGFDGRDRNDDRLIARFLFLHSFDDRTSVPMTTEPLPDADDEACRDNRADRHRRPRARGGVAGAPAAGARRPAGDPVHGKTLYQGCEGCHSIDENDVGPKHRGVVGRQAPARVPDYAVLGGAEELRHDLGRSHA